LPTRKVGRGRRFSEDEGKIERKKERKKGKGGKKRGKEALVEGGGRLPPFRVRYCTLILSRSQPLDRRVGRKLSTFSTSATPFPVCGARGTVELLSSKRLALLCAELPFTPFLCHRPPFAQLCTRARA
jgi:hypothetical protein